MTHGDINLFLSSITEAKRALDAEPQLQETIRNQQKQIDGMIQTVAARELRIHDLKQNEETLTAKLRSVEAERDDAGFRALEEADKVQNLLSVVQRFITDGLAAVSAVEGTVRTVVTKADLDAKDKEISELQWKASETDTELQRLKDDMRLAQEQLTRPFAPSGATSFSNVEGTDPFYKPEPYVGDKRVADPFANNPSSSLPQSPSVSSGNVAPADDVYTTSDKRAVDPTASGSDPIPQGLGNESAVGPIASSAPNSLGNASTVPATDTVPTTISAQSEGQSEGPFAMPLTLTQPPSASSQSATNETSAVSSASQTPPERNRDRSTFFTGRKYFDVTYFVPLHQWLNEGGSRDDYYWRPAEANVALPEPNRASHQS